MHVHRSNVGQIKLASGLTVVVGIWEILAPFVLGYSLVPPPTINAVLIGFIITILASIRFFGAFDAAWLSWINAALGVWLILAPFILGYRDAAMVNDIIVGIIVLMLGTWSALLSADGIYNP